MRSFLSLATWAFVASLAPACLHAETSINDAASLVPTEYRHRLVQQMSLADRNSQQWLETIVKATPDHREALAFLLANMPERDLKSLSGDFVLRDIDLACEARAKFPWAVDIPKEIFFNEVLPYANLNERRDDWRADFLKRFGSEVAECKTAGDAAQILNRKVFKDLKVAYHATKRLKPDQSPYESMDVHYASCSGLAIILVDACRAVGVPARVAGTALWSDKSGNHTWVEVWDGQWRFIGAAEPGEFNKTWFADNAAKADDTSVEQRIHAASFRQTREPFLMVWDPRSTEFPAVDVTHFYIARKKLTINVVDPLGTNATATVQIRKDGELLAQGTGKSVAFELAAGDSYTVKIQSADGRHGEDKITLPKDADAAVELHLLADPPK